MNSQAENILAYLKTGRTLTPLQALDMFGCMRLSGRIYDIKAQGHPIAMELIKDSNGKTYAKYSMLAKETLF